MKVLSTIILSFVLFVGALYAVDTQFSPAMEKGAKSAPARLAREDGEVAYSSPGDIRTESVAANLPGTVVGETAYNYQTNDNLHDRIWYDPASGTIHTQWMFGDIAEVPGFLGRRMYYNFWDGSSWVHGKGVSIENRRAGYGALAVNPNNAAITASHFTTTNEEAIDAWWDFDAGFGFFSQANIWEARNDGTKDLEPFWPDIAVDDKDYWYISATNNNQDDWVRLVNNVNDNILYYRSIDKGNTWSEPLAMFPDTSTYRLGSGASGDNEAGSHQIEVADNGSGKIGLLVSNPGHDFLFFESTDRGVTFPKAKQILGNAFPDVTDSLSYPIRWDVVVELDSTTKAPIDTSLYPFTRDTNDDGTVSARVGYHTAPHGPSDLFYLKGEPHIVWNEDIWTAESTYYPNGTSLTWTTPFMKFIDGDSVHEEGGFAIKHWSPSTGVSTIYKADEIHEVWASVFQQFVTMPQIGADAAGNLYCVFTRCSDADTVVASDGIAQAETDFGPLAFGRIWGAKSTDGGKTWGDAVQLIAEEDCYHQNLRYIGIANKNPNDKIHILFQNTPGFPGTAIGGAPDHTSWATAEMRHWAIPASAFPTTKTKFFGPDIELVTSTTLGGVAFGDIGNAGQAQKTFTVKNVGDQELKVENAFAGEKSFTLSPATFTVAPGASQVVTITFRPLRDAEFDTYIALPNNDPNEKSVGFPVTGKGVYIPVGVAERSDAAPSNYDLAQNYPNPFNPTTTLQFSLPQAGHARLTVYNTLGKEISVLIDKDMTAGLHRLEWTPENLSSGVYFYQLSAGEYKSTRKMILMQ
ncbi:MAG: T9SS C-terminal target domain-containing protein [Calditrichaeota bacterium]|nr:MAG: T9SS C-terminal target domain-containing protein [Calditrichota bacterium]